jgi:hypothetical protein
MRCHNAERVHGVPAVDCAQPVDLLRLEPGPWTQDDHVARGVAQFRRHEFRVALESARLNWVIPAVLRVSEAVTWKMLALSL